MFASLRGGRRTILAWAIAIPFAAWALIRLLGADRGYPLVSVVAFTPYAALASLVAVALVVALRVRAAIVCAAVASVLLLVGVVPRAMPGGGVSEPADGVELTVMTANLHFGEADAQTVVELVREEGVDVLSVQELTPGAVDRLRKAGLGALLPEAVVPAEEGASGGGLYASGTLVSTGNLGRRDTGFRQPSATAEIDGVPLALASVHPVPPTSPETTDRWRDAIRALPAAGQADEFGLLLGDFNATLDHHELRSLIDRGYVDAADVTGGGLAPTWHRSVWPPITIDHLLVDERAHVAAAETHDLPGSDHEVVVARLVLPADGP